MGAAKCSTSSFTLAGGPGMPACWRLHLSFRNRLVMLAILCPRTSLILLVAPTKFTTGEGMRVLVAVACLHSTRPKPWGGLCDDQFAHHVDQALVVMAGSHGGWRV